MPFMCEYALVKFGVINNPVTTSQVIKFTAVEGSTFFAPIIREITCPCERVSLWITLNTFYVKVLAVPHPLKDAPFVSRWL